MYKIIALIPRKPGMTREEFRDYYENGHAKLAAKHVPQLKGYIRNHLTPLEGFDAGELPYDAVVEFYYESKEVWDEVGKQYLEGDMGKVLIPDEENFMDRNRMLVLVAEECVSDDVQG